MPLKRDKSGRLHIESSLMGESLMDKTLLADTDTHPVFRLMPDLIVVKIGGQSIIDRGRVALLPILDELVEARNGWRHPRPARLCDRHRFGHAYRGSCAFRFQHQRAECSNGCYATHPAWGY